MNSPHRLLLLSAASALASVPVAQNRPTASSFPPEASIAVQLHEFQVISERDPTYRATNANGGTRLGTKINDLPQSITVLTEDFLPDTGTIDPVRPVTRGQDGTQIINGNFLLVPHDIVGRVQTGAVHHRLLAGCEVSRDRARHDV